MNFKVDVSTCGKIWIRYDFQVKYRPLLKYLGMSTPFSHYLSDLYPEYPLFACDNVKKLRAFHINTLSDLLAKDCEKIVNILDVSYTEVIPCYFEDLSLRL